MTDFDKEAYELDVFKKFVRITDVGIEPGSIEQRGAPSPDIVCIDSEGHRGFELTRLTDKFIEKKSGSGLQKYSNYKIEVNDVVSIIDSKSEKNYDSEFPIDLVIHEGSTEIGDLWLYDQSDVDKALNDAALSSPFSRVWVLDISNVRYRVYPKKTVKPCF